MTMLPRLSSWLAAAVIVLIGSAQPAWAQADMTVGFPLDPLFENGTNRYPIVITNDPDNNAQITVTGSNSELVPPDSLTVLGTGANRTVVYRPPFDKSGVTNLTFTLRDPGPIESVTHTLQVFPATAVPRAPTAVHATGGTLGTFQWTDPTSGAASDLPSYYLLEMGDAPGLTAISPIRVPSRVAGVTVNLPRGGYNFRLRPGNRLGLGAVSAEASVGVANGPDVPGPPGGVAISLSASNVATLTWTRPGFGSTPASYVLEVGTVSGATDIGRFSLPATFRLNANVGPGTYVVRMRGVTAAGEGLPSPEVFLTVPSGSCSPPSAPVLSTLVRNGPFLMVPWTPPATGQAQAYNVVAGTSPGAADIAVLQVGPSSSLSIAAPPGGIYHVFVQALSTCGPPANSNVVTYVEPAPAAPGAPLGLNATTGPGSATLAWNPPVSGGRVESYVLEAGFTAGGVDIVVPLSNVPGISFAGVVPGTYFARMRARNAFGTSATSNEITLTIP